jgi:hypothetical protein
VVKLIRLSRFTLIGFTLAFGLYHAVLGVLNYINYELGNLALLAIALYLVALILSLFSFKGLALQSRFAYFNLAIAAVVPALMSFAIPPEMASGYSTWHVAGIATLMGITAVRQHRWIAWTGVAFDVVIVLIWGGFGILFNSGVIGAVMLVAAAHGASNTLRSSAKAARQFRDQELANNAAQAARSAARKERQVRVDEALSTSLPFLQMLVEKKGRLTNDEKAEALLIERTLRDQIRGRMLLTPELVEAVRQARMRGVEVQLLDDGGLEDVDEQEKHELLAKIAAEVSKVHGGKVVIRAVPGEDWKITLAAIRKESDKPDLFIRL